MNISSLVTSLEQSVITHLNSTKLSYINIICSTIFSSLISSLILFYIYYKSLKQNQVKNNICKMDIACQTDTFHPKPVFIPHPQVGRGKPIWSFRD